MPFSVNHLTPLFFGPHMALRTGMRLRELGVTKVLFIYDQGVKKAGIPDKIISNVEALGINVSVYEGVQPDPPDYTVDEAAEIGLRDQVDGVVGLGGGSSMDTAKAANLMLTNPPGIQKYLGGMRAQFKPGKPLILIPTTSGTGSEVTTMAVLTDTRDHRKKGPGGPYCRANVAIVDPVLTVGMPPQITADTGMDAFAHAFEAVTSGQAHPMSDLLGMRAIDLICRNLPTAVRNGQDLDARTNMSFAATLAGYAFTDSITHLGHSIGHALGSSHHVPHGNACVLAMPEIAEFVAEYTPGIKRVGQAMGLSVAEVSAKEAGIMVRDAIRALNKEVGIKGLQQHNIKESELLAIAAAAANEGPANFSPKKASSDDWLVMLKAAYSYKS
jgi:alcohol dehydrogenase